MSSSAASFISLTSSTFFILGLPTVQKIFSVRAEHTTVVKKRTHILEIKVKISECQKKYKRYIFCHYEIIQKNTLLLLPTKKKKKKEETNMKLKLTQPKKKTGIKKDEFYYQRK